MAEGNLSESASVVLDGSGNGSVRLGPLTAREVWFPVNASVRVDYSPDPSPTNEAQCQIFVGETATPENFRDLTFSGSSGDASGKVTGRVPKNWFIWAVWSGGDAGKTATLNVSGKKEI